jgi:serine/threonine protein kinase
LIAKKSYPKKRFACKKIDRDSIKRDVHMLERELDILMEVDHPNIINFHEIYMDENHFHFVTQLCEGGELYQ